MGPISRYEKIYNLPPCLGVHHMAGCRREMKFLEMIRMRNVYLLGLILLAILIPGAMAYQPIGPVQQQPSPFMYQHAYITPIYNDMIVPGMLPPPLFLFPGDEVYVAVSSSTPVNIYTMGPGDYSNYMMGSVFSYYPELSAQGVTSWGSVVQVPGAVELYVVVEPLYAGEMPVLTILRGSDYSDDQHLTGYQQTVDWQGEQMDRFVKWYQRTFDPGGFSYG